jgi:hypothetical protein
MKVEAVCTNDGCPTVTGAIVDGEATIERAVQLLSCEKIHSGGKVAIDENDQILCCPFCATPVLVTRLSKDEAQFPMGQLEVYDEAKKLLAWDTDNDDPLAWTIKGTQLLARHLAGDAGSASSGILESGDRVSCYVVANTPLWITTKANGTRTVIDTSDPEVT